MFGLKHSSLQLHELYNFSQIHCIYYPNFDLNQAVISLFSALGGNESYSGADLIALFNFVVLEAHARQHLADPRAERCGLG